MPPGQVETEVRLWASELPLDDLIVAQAVIEAELGQRTGREKFQIPAHVQQMLN